MKRNTALVALAAWLLSAPIWAQVGYAERQLKQNGFSANMQRAMSRTSDPYKGTQDAPEYYGQSQALPPITLPAGNNGPAPQMSLPPISGNIETNGQSNLSSQMAAPVQRPRPAPVVRSSGNRSRATGGNEVYSQEPLNLPPVTNLPVPSRTALPPISDDTMMMVPLEEAVTRVLACNFKGYTGLIQTTSADVSKAGSFKMG
jgi:hypothetical protein